MEVLRKALAMGSYQPEARTILDADVGHQSHLEHLDAYQGHLRHLGHPRHLGHLKSYRVQTRSLGHLRHQGIQAI